MFLLLSVTVKAQVTVNATSGLLTGSYTTLKSAFDAINLGLHHGHISIIINGSTVEAAPAVLYGSGGTSSYSTVTITPSVTCAITGNIVGPLIDLNGADSVIIDGRIGGNGTTRSLTVQNTCSTGPAVCTIRLINGARNNMLRYLTIEGLAVPTSPNGTVVISGSTPATNSNSFNTIDNNEIRPVNSGLQFVGILVPATSTPAMSNDSFNVITNNLIHDFYCSGAPSCGIRITKPCTDFTISQNSIYQTSAIYQTVSAPPTNSFIEVNYGSGHLISRNYIGGSAPFATGASKYIGAFGIIGIYCNSAATTFSIDSNIIRNFELTATGQTSGLPSFQGILAIVGNYNIGLSHGNVVGSLTDTSSIKVQGTIIGIRSFGGVGSGNTNIQNNEIGGLTIRGNYYSSDVLAGIRVETLDTATIKSNIVGGGIPGSLKIVQGIGTIQGIAMYHGKNNRGLYCADNLIRNIYNNNIGTSSTSTCGIWCGSQYNNQTYFFKVINNIIYNLYDSSVNAGSSVQGICAGPGLPGINSFMNNVLRKNVISDLHSLSVAPSSSVSGISNEGRANFYIDIDSNEISSMTCSASNPNTNVSPALQGINFLYPGNDNVAVTITANKVSDILATSSAATNIAGINCLHGSSGQLSVAANKIYGLDNSSSIGGSASGIRIAGPGTGYILLKNNMVRLSSNTNYLYGISNDAFGASQVQVFYNSIAIEGNDVSNNTSAAFYRSVNASAVLNIEDNIFQNTRSGSVGNRYAIINAMNNPASGWTHSNFNDLYSSNPATAVEWGTTPMGFSAYKAASLQDSCSKNVPADFVSSASGDLHLINPSINNLTLSGRSIPGITTDIDNNPRNPFPAIGADEIILPFQGVSVSASGPLAFCAGTHMMLYSSQPTGNQWYKNGLPIFSATSDSLLVDSTGTYSVYYSDGCLLSASSLINVTVHPIPSDTVSVSICNGQSYTFGSVALTSTGMYRDTFNSVANCDSIVTLYLTVIMINDSISLNDDTLSTVASGSYQWVSCTDSGNVIIPGATSQSFVPANDGSYAVMISNGGCTVISDCIAVSISSVPQLSVGREVNIYPNPGKDRFSVTSSAPFSDASIVIRNSLGQVIRTQSGLKGYRLDVDMQAFNSGIYFIVVTDDRYTIHLSWSKQ